MNKLKILSIAAYCLVSNLLSEALCMDRVQENEEKYIQGQMYYYGEGVPQDYSKALSFYEQSACQGNALAQMMLGFCYENARGVPQDLVRAATFYKQSSDQGNVLAKTHLARCYNYGYGVPHNDSIALNLYEQALKQQRKDFIGSNAVDSSPEFRQDEKIRQSEPPAKPEV